MKIYDLEGQERSAEWLQATYGNLRVEARPIDGPGWVVEELREREGPAIYLVEGEPALYIARWWPADDHPLLPTVLQTWQTHARYAQIKPEGHCDFGGGQGDYYYPDQGQEGPTWIWAEGNSECVKGLGFLPGTEHRRMDARFAWDEGGVEPPPEPPPPEPPPTGTEWDTLFAYLDEIIRLLKIIAGES